MTICCQLLKLFNSLFSFQNFIYNEVEVNFLIYRVKSVMFNINLILKYDLGDNNVSL